MKLKNPRRELKRQDWTKTRKAKMRTLELKTARELKKLRYEQFN